jgi:hypothetical protein
MGSVGRNECGECAYLVDVEDVDSVYRLVSELREKTRTAKGSF